MAKVELPIKNATAAREQYFEVTDKIPAEVLVLGRVEFNRRFSGPLSRK